MSIISKLKDSKYLEDLFERAGKTFGQFYLGYWLFLNPGTDIDSASAAFDSLFSTDNLKAGVVGVALSVASSVGSRYVGSKDNASLIKT